MAICPTLFHFNLLKGTAANKSTQMKVKNNLVATVLLLSSVILLISCKRESSSSVKPTANFSFSGTGLAPASVNFTNTSSNATSYLWDFGDGSAVSNFVNPTHTYTQGGVFTVILTAISSAGTNVISKTVNISTPTAVKIKSIKLIGMPFSDPACSCGWDNTSGADVYFALTTNSDIILATGAVFANVSTTGLPLLWNFSTPYQIAALSSTYKVKIYDNDVSDILPSPDDFMGGYGFSFSTYASSGYPTKITLQTSTSAFVIEITVEWL